MLYLQLVWEFFKTGLFTIGGGLASLPFLQNIADRYNWYTRAQLVDMIAVSESTPGAIGINMATFVGYKLGGVLTSILSTLALILPSFIIVTLVARVLSRFNENPLVRSAFYGLRPAVCAMIASAGWGVIKISLLNMELFSSTGRLLDLFDFKAVILFALILPAIIKWKKHPIVYIGAAALIGIVFQL